MNSNGCAKVSLQQVLRADRAAWTRLIEVNTPIRRDAAGHLPLDTELIRALEAYDVAFNLVPLPKAAVPTLVKSDLKEHKQTYHSDQNQWYQPERFHDRGHWKSKPYPYQKVEKERAVVT